jgi:hypothetical protein
MEEAAKEAGETAIEKIVEHALGKVVARNLGIGFDAIDPNITAPPSSDEFNMTRQPQFDRLNSNGDRSHSSSRGQGERRSGESGRRGERLH